MFAGCEVVKVSGSCGGSSLGYSVFIRDVSVSVEDPVHLDVCYTIVEFVG